MILREDAAKVTPLDTLFELQRLTELALTLGRHMRPEQFASALEEFELTCYERGWALPGGAS